MTQGVVFVKIDDYWINLFEIVTITYNNAVRRRGSRIKLTNGSIIYSKKQPEELVQNLKEAGSYTYML